MGVELQGTLLFAGLVALGFLFTFWKCSWRARLEILSHPVKVDCAIAGALVLIHGGSFSGTMVAALAALFISAILFVFRLLFGHFAHDPASRRRYYKAGWFNRFHAAFPSTQPARKSP
jgi:hypothetical protein